MAHIIDGKEISGQIKAELKENQIVLNSYILT